MSVRKNGAIFQPVLITILSDIMHHFVSFLWWLSAFKITHLYF